MSGILLVSGFVFLGAIRVINSLFNEKDPIDYSGKHRYIINDKVSLLHPLTKSYKVLDLPNDILLSPSVIHKALHKQLEFANEDRLLGYTMKYTIQEYQTAKQYLLDYYEYMAHLN